MEKKSKILGWGMEEMPIFGVVVAGAGLKGRLG